MKSRPSITLPLIGILVGIILLLLAWHFAIRPISGGIPSSPPSPTNTEPTAKKLDRKQLDAFMVSEVTPVLKQFAKHNHGEGEITNLNKGKE